MLVPFSIPGERVRIALRAGAAAATLVEVLRPSPHRIAAPCRHFGVCGGCAWQHIAYAEQLRLKTALVDRLVRAAVPHAPAARPMLPSTPVHDPWGYRHKAHFVFGHGQPLMMGHYARGSRRVIAVRECPVHDPRANRLAFAFRDLLPPSDALVGLAVRAGANTPELTATLVVSGDADRRLRTATRRLLDGDEAPTGFHLNLHPGRGALIVGRHTRRIAGPERMREQVGDVSYLISPTSFFQTNVAAAGILVRLVLEACAPLRPARVLDLYAGAGLFALPLARLGHRVVAVEENREAVADGEASARLNRIAAGGCRFLARPAEALPEGAFDLVVLDPPREGCAATVLRRVFGRVRPQRAVYVSCNPEALARDARIIASHGYRIASLQPVDMFPHTAHVETVAVLVR